MRFWSWSPCRLPTGGNKVTRRLWLALTVLVVILLQTAVFPFINLFGVGPDFALIFVVLLGFLGGAPLGLAAGLITGLFIDVWLGRLIGFHILFKTVGAAVGFLVGRQVYRENATAAFSLVAGATIVQELSMFVLLRSIGVGMPLYRALYYVILPGLLYNLLLTPPLYLALYALTDRLPVEARQGER